MRYLPCFLLLSAWPLMAQTATPLISVNSASNNSSTGTLSGVAPVRAQHGNFGMGCSGGTTITPIGQPVGQLYATAAIQTSAQGAGCATQGVPTVTSSGTGIATTDNGNSAGGTDSATAFTDTYGNTTFDSVCSGDTYQTTPTLFSGLPVPPCVTGSSAVYSETTDPAHPNASMLWPSLYQSNSTTLDSAMWYMRDYYFRIVSNSTVRNAEFDVNVNASPTLYTACATTVAGDCGYFGWGSHYSNTVTMWQYCPQNCSGWKSFKFCAVDGSGCITSYTITANQWYHVRQYGYRLPNCNYNSASNCYFYAYMTIYPVGVSAPVTYALLDSTGILAGGIPVNHSTWAAGPVPQEQIDRSDTNGGAGEVDVENDTTTVFALTPTTSAFQWSVP